MRTVGIRLKFSFIMRGVPLHMVPARNQNGHHGRRKIPCSVSRHLQAGLKGPYIHPPSYRDRHKQLRVGDIIEKVTKVLITPQPHDWSRYAGHSQTGV